MHSIDSAVRNTASSSNVMSVQTTQYVPPRLREQAKSNNAWPNPSRLRRVMNGLRRHLGHLGLGALALVAATIAYYRFAIAPLAVHTHVVSSGEIIAEVMGTGTLESRTKNTISTKITGRIAEVLVDQGDRVKAAQILVRLDDRDLRHQVEVEEANVSARKASVERLIADTNFAQSTLDLATKNFERARNLIGRKSISQEEYDRDFDAFTTGKAGLERAEAALVEGRKQLIAAERILQLHQARLDDTVIRAPFDGLIVRRDRDPGEVVVPGSSVLLLISLQEMWVRAWVDEMQMTRLKPGQPVRVIFRSQPSQPCAGRVARLAREADRETREFLVEVLVEQLPKNWAVGQRAEVYIETAHKSNAILLPNSFLVMRGGQPGVFAAIGGQASWRPLRLGLRGREATVEIAQGLQPGDVVIRPRDPKAGPLADGRKVTVP
jgi:HlyD family secretion protein